MAYTSRKITIGTQAIGGGHPVLIQSMCNTPTSDAEATAGQCMQLFDAGAAMVRMTVRNLPEARNLSVIMEILIGNNYFLPLIADVHFNPEIAMTAAGIVQKVRINPGNFAGEQFRDPLIKLIGICRKQGTVLRIGVNHGSLSERIMMQYGNSPEGMVVSAMEYLTVCYDHGFKDVVVSLKSSNTAVMIQANRQLVRHLITKGWDPAIHLGVTEAGEGEDGRIRSAIGIGTLLKEGIGDTIRVSLTEDPAREIPAAEKIIRAVGRLAGPATGLTAGPVTGQTIDKTTVQADGQAVVEPIEPGLSQIQADNEKPLIHPPLVPLVIADADPSGKEQLIREEPVPDYLYTGKPFPVATNSPVERIGFDFVHIDELKHEYPRTPAGDDHSVLILEADDPVNHAQLSQAARELSGQGLQKGFVLKINYDLPDREFFMIKAAVDAGGLFVDRICGGIWLRNPLIGTRERVEISFNILQSAGVRTFKTEYIACPTCGRTQFDINQVLKSIKEHTSHLKHLKIAVMGCIVNGPGEMADADYGYVGSGRNKVTLYRGKEAVKKNITRAHALRELISLIKSDGRWVERKVNERSRGKNK